MFATDFQQPATSLLLKANGKSVVTELVYPHRFSHCKQLNLMGADIQLHHNAAYVDGVKELVGADVMATDIRSGMSLVMAALGARGTSRIFGVEHLERGFQNFVETLTGLGANICLVEEKDAETASRKGAVAELSNVGSIIA